MRLIQSGEKECADLSGHSGLGYLVFSSAQSTADYALLKVNRLRWRPAAQMDVAKSD